GRRVGVCGVWTALTAAAVETASSVAATVRLQRVVAAAGMRGDYTGRRHEGGAMRALTRREALTAAAAAAVLPLQSLAAQPATPAVVKGRLKQSVSRWCYSKIPMPEFCEAVKAMGLTAIDLLEEPDWAVVADHGLICSMGYAGVTICVELLNSKVDHKGYQGDRTLFGVEVVKAVNSPRVKLLYDAYHMQI